MQLSNSVSRRARRAALLGAARALAGVAGVASLACGEGAPPARTGADPAASTEAPRRGVVALELEAKKAGSRPLPFAFVEGKVGDRPARFIVDTGVSVHAVDAAVASAANLGASPNASQLSIDGWGALPAHAVAVRELSATLRTHGIDGVVSPQLLAEGGQAVVLDLANRQLRQRPRATAWSELADLGVVLTAPGTKPCAFDEAGAGGVALAIDATVDGEPARLAVDTGASRTALVEGATAAAKVAAHPVLGRSVAVATSGDVPTSIHGGVPLTVGGLSTTSDVGLAPGTRHAQCGYEGRIGMDLLQRCALAITSDQLMVACRTGH